MGVYYVIYFSFYKKLRREKGSITTKLGQKDSVALNNRCLSHPTITMNNITFFKNGSSKKAYFNFQKAYS